MQAWPRAAYRYTPYFCEENVWWLARSLVDEGLDRARLEVWVFSNPGRGVLLRDQRLAGPGRWLQWDYHVVLYGRFADGNRVFDFDSRLDFPSDADRYLRRTFPDQSALPPQRRAWVRRIPAAAYLRHFCSDRRHMLGQRPLAEFPDYPPICPTDTGERIALQDYWDMRKALPDDSRVCAVRDLALD